MRDSAGSRPTCWVWSYADGRAGHLTGPAEGDGIAMCLVPEEKTVKHRVHIDGCAEVPGLVARGASMLLPAEESGLRMRGRGSTS